MQATKDDAEKLQTGLEDLRFFQTQKQDCGALLYVHVFLFSQHLAQRCNTTRCIHSLTDTLKHTHTHSLVKPCVVILPGQISLCVETPRGLGTLSSWPLCIHPPHCCLGLPG